MSERDADDAGGDDSSGEDGASAEDGDHEPESTSNEEGCEPAPDPDLDDIAVEPDGDASVALADVLEGTGVDVDLADVDGAEIDPPIELVERVEEADPERLALELSALRRQVEALQSQLETREEEVTDLESRLARKQADFQNYKKRREEQVEARMRRATEDLIERLLDVRDNLARALDQDEDAEIRGGVESTLRQLDAEFERENVEVVEPEPGDDVDPQRHEVLVRVESDRPEGTVADVHRPGYEMAGKVLRAAQVTVSEGPGPADDRDAGEVEGEAGTASDEAEVSDGDDEDDVGGT